MQREKGAECGMSGKILLTGGAGYIGSHTCIALADAGFTPVIFDNFSNARRDVISRLSDLIGRPVLCHEGDVLNTADLAAVFAAHSFKAVIHLAARKAVGESVRLPLDYFQTNLSGLLNLLFAMRRAGVRRMVFSSSATVYAETDVLPIPETARKGYSSPYAFTKLMGERMIEQAAEADPEWRFGILRYFNPAGAHRSGRIGEDPTHLPNNLMPFLGKVATGELPALMVFGDDYPTPDGTGVRDYIHVEDLARGHVASLNALLDRNLSHAVNLGSGEGHSVFDMLKAYSRAVGRSLPHVVAPRRAGDLASYYSDPTLAADLLGFKTELGIDDMCVSSWRWAKWSKANLS